MKANGLELDREALVEIARAVERDFTVADVEKLDVIQKYADSVRRLVAVTPIGVGKLDQFVDMLRSVPLCHLNEAAAIAAPVLELVREAVSETDALLRHAARTEMPHVAFEWNETKEQLERRVGEIEFLLTRGARLSGART